MESGRHASLARLIHDHFRKRKIGLRMKVRHFQQIITLNSRQQNVLHGTEKNFSELVTKGESILPLLPRHRALCIPLV
jgi:hypothetical protein